jgi:HK97 family phage portal protein
MKLLASISAMFGGRPRDPTDEFWWTSPAAVPMGTAVTADTVIQIPEVYDCLQVLSQTIGALPLFVYRRLPDGSKERFDDHPVASLLRAQSNGIVNSTAYELRAQMTWDLALHRNAFAEIVAGRSGPVSELVRIDPCCVQIVKGSGRGQYLYEVREGGQTRRLLREDMLHLRVPPLTSDGLMGRSLLSDGVRVFQRALALEDYARLFFENDATPSIVITLPGKFANRQQAEEYRQKWINQFGRQNRHKPAVLDQNGKVSTINVDNNKAQFLETYMQVALQICRLWRMPPHKVGILTDATFSNIEQQSLEFVTDTLLSWLVAWEQALNRDLIAPLTPGMFAEHNVAGLLRGDLKARYEGYAIARNWGWLSVNDIRRLENMNPVDHGDVYLQPLNMAPAGADLAELQRNRQPTQPPGALLMALEGVLSRRLLPGPGD